MKITLIFLFFFHFSTFVQCDSTNIVGIPDVDATFPGGTVCMKEFIQQHLEYPPLKRYQCEQFIGTIYLKFIVCSDGSIQNIVCHRSTGTEFDQIAIDLIKKMPKWIPGSRDDLPIASYVHLPIRIDLQ